MQRANGPKVDVQAAEQPQPKILEEPDSGMAHTGLAQSCLVGKRLPGTVSGGTCP